jgi:hypothetical protein
VKNATASATLLIARREITQSRVARDVEGTDARVDQPLRSRDAAGKCHSTAVIGDVIIHARVELRLFGPFVLERGIWRVEPVWNRPNRTRQRILREVARRQLVCPVVVDGFGVRAVHVKEPSGILVAAADVAVEAADADRERGAFALHGHFAGRSRQHVDDAVHRVGAPHGGRRTANDLDLPDFIRVGGHEIPHDHAEEVQIDAAAIDEGELRGGERRRRAA